MGQRDRIFRYIDAHPGHTRLEISRETGVPINAVCGRVAELIKPGIVIEGTARRDALTGRPGCPLYVNEPVTTQYEQARLAI